MRVAAYLGCQGRARERCQCADDAGRGAEDARQAAVVSGAPAVGDGRGLEEGEVAADHARRDDQEEQERVRAWGDGQGCRGRAAYGDQGDRAGGDAGTAGETGVEGATQGLARAEDRGATGKAGPDEANPRNGNKHGHILELEERRGDAAAKSFQWKLLLVCGDPDDPSTYFAGFDKNQVSPISCPDNVAFDEYGNLWIATDGAALGFHDGLFAVPLKGAQRGNVQQFLSMPKGAECCGPIITKDRILVAPQHPGETRGATAENPGSAWPDGPGKLPRPSMIAVWKD